MKTVNARPKLPPVVLIDDEPEEIFFAVHALKKAGVDHPISTFYHAEAAVDYFRTACVESNESPAAVVFCDIKMPGLDGFEVVRALRGMPKMAKVPIWMISGSDAPSDLNAAKMSGADGYIVKPAIPADFAAVIYGHQPTTGKHGRAVPFGARSEIT